LLAINFALSVALTIAVLVLRDQVINYQLAHTSLPPGTDEEMMRRILQNTIWTRLAAIVIASLVYLWLARRLLRGHRRAYLRVIYLAVAGLIGIGFLLTQPYPIWMRVEQCMRAAVLVALLWAVTRPEVRRQFARAAKP
jgi:hypothetical protein